MSETIWSQCGTRRSNEDWSDPGSWVPRILDGEQRLLAERMLVLGNGALNPRYADEVLRFLLHHDLLEVTSDGEFRQSAAGVAVLDGQFEGLSAMEERERVVATLRLLGETTRVRLRELHEAFAEVVRDYTTNGTTVTTCLRTRLNYLVSRSLALHEGQFFRVTAAGRRYLDAAGTPETDERSKIILEANDFNTRLKAQVRERLLNMPPFAFEHLVKALLDQMGYEDVEVTKQSGDKGVDVVARVQFGITTITEVVQVKRVAGTIGRPVIDQLRGALPYHKAIRGTIITTGSYSKGCEEAALYPGAAPITLIDGDRLMQMLEDHGIGFRRRTVHLLDVDEDLFLKDVVGGESGEL